MVLPNAINVNLPPTCFYG